MRIEGKVIQGKQLGRTIGFPTANLETDVCMDAGLYGVYAAWFLLDGRRLPCMLNIGRHPTLPEGAPSVEAHIFDFSGDLYGKHGIVETVVFLRPEQKFSTPEALQAQLAADRKRALALLMEA